MNPPAKPGQPLTRRELQVLRLIANGHIYDDIAAALGIAGGTVRSHVGRIFVKLNVHTQAHAVAHAFATGTIGPADIGRTEAAEEAFAANRGATQRLLVTWRRTTPPQQPRLIPVWWRQRLDELAHAIRKDTTP